MAIPSPEILRPSPLDLGNTLSGAVNVFRRRASTFVLIALLQGVAVGVLILAALALFFVGIGTSISQQSVSALLIVSVIAMFVATVGSLLVQVKGQAMIVLGAHDEIHGQPSTLGDLFRRTSGVVGRILMLGLALVGAIFLLYGAFTALIVVMTMRAATGGSSSSAGALAGVIILFVVVMIAVGIAAVYFQVRFLYLIQALAIENQSAIDGLKRSWALTKGNVLRTLGYYLVASLIVGVISYLAQILPQMFLTPAMEAAGRGGAVEAVFTAMIPFMVVLMLLQIAVQLLATPF
ncbi:MAG: glycerophosphoryl diester phosphodiesterase membrane domain-containing protein, partial [Propionibacteriaceae bacterium]|nr:glycerophosphoryl diester phosphodiesterase membrane domain-containing protein [Propionibacteriaceae bacterium]